MEEGGGWGAVEPLLSTMLGLAVRWDGSVEDMRADVCSLVAWWLSSADVEEDGGGCCRAFAEYGAAADESKAEM